MEETVKIKKTKSKGKPPKLTEKRDVKVRARFFMIPSYLFGTALIYHFCTFMQCAQQPSGSLLCGFYVAFNMLNVLVDITSIKKAAVSIYCSALTLLIFSI